jgi:hypothetical protein
LSDPQRIYLGTTSGLYVRSQLPSVTDLLHKTHRSCGFLWIPQRPKEYCILFTNRTEKRKSVMSGHLGNYCCYFCKLPKFRNGTKNRSLSFFSFYLNKTERTNRRAESFLFGIMTTSHHVTLKDLLELGLIKSGEEITFKNEQGKFSVRVTRSLGFRSIPRTGQMTTEITATTNPNHFLINDAYWKRDLF